jgi:hypothetical protein
VERLGHLFSDLLGRSARVRLERVVDTEEVEGAKGSPSIYDAALVKLAQRELDARPMTPES